MIFPEDRARVVADLAPLHQGAPEVFLQFRAMHRDGSIRWMEGSCSNRLDDPRVGALVSNFRDITARKDAEQALSESRDRLEEAQAIAHVGSWSSGPSAFDELVWSRECYRIFGVAEGTPVTVASFFDCVHPDDRERVRSASRDAWVAAVPYDIEHRVLRSEGDVRWVRERAVVSCDLAGSAVRMVGTVQDVTDRRLATEALRASESEFRLLAESMPQIAWVARPDGGNVYVNQLWTEYTGLNDGESIDDGWNKTIHADDRVRVWQIRQDAIATGQTFTTESCSWRTRTKCARWPVRFSASTATRCSTRPTGERLF